MERHCSERDLLSAFSLTLYIGMACGSPRDSFTSLVTGFFEQVSARIRKASCTSIRSESR